MRKFLLSLTVLAGVGAAATAASAAPVVRPVAVPLPAIGAPALVQPVQYYEHYRYREWRRHHEWERFRRHEAWRRWHYRHGW